MANDPPTSLGMRFGAKEAFQSGMSGFRVPTTSQMNASIGWEREQAEIRKLVKEHPEFSDMVREMIAEQTARKEWCTTYILQALHWKIAQKSKK
jgi:hypothetical protein